MQRDMSQQQQLRLGPLAKRRAEADAAAGAGAGAGALVPLWPSPDSRLQFEAARLCELPAISHFMRDGFISTHTDIGTHTQRGGRGERDTSLMLASTDGPLQLQRQAARAGDQVRASEPADV